MVIKSTRGVDMAQLRSWVEDLENMIKGRVREEIFI
jgi:hypothetical protein